MPAAANNGNTTNFIDALFTATSATAVTGLVVVNTAEHWSIFGKTIIMILIQIGGFGFMTSTTMIYFVFGKRMYLRERLIIMEELNYNKLAGVIRLTRYIIILTFSIELIGAALLFFNFKNYYPILKAFYYSLFHSISAFNNAGFDIFGNSLENYVDSLYINIIISSLFIIGGLGFLVISEIYHKRKFKLFSLHTRLVIFITVNLILLGSIAFFILEYNNPATIGNLSLKGKIIASYFQGVTPRTAGFNTLPINYLKDETLFIIILLMFIGASPGSTGGGVKTTTIGTLFIVVYNMAFKKENIEIFARRLKKKDIYKALTIVVLSLIIIAFITLVLSLTEEFAFIQILFEVFSAFGTVGLSTGITPKISSIGRLFIIFTMFIGRVGPFTVALALGNKNMKGIRYPEEEIIIG